MVKRAVELEDGPLKIELVMTRGYGTARLSVSVVRGEGQLAENRRG
mgnify:CR=1 FL=1